MEESLSVQKSLDTIGFFSSRQFHCLCGWSSYLFTSASVINGSGKHCMNWIVLSICCALNGGTFAFHLFYNLFAGYKIRNTFISTIFSNLFQLVLAVERIAIMSLLQQVGFSFIYCCTYFLLQCSFDLWADHSTTILIFDIYPYMYMVYSIRRCTKYSRCPPLALPQVFRRTNCR